MKKDKFTITDAVVSGKESYPNRKFWLRAFAVYAGAEAVYIVINYFTTRSICSSCVMPPSFYISQWIINLLFTALLWYCLYRFYHQPLWIIITGNILLFVAYYFLWLWMLYLLIHSGRQWLTGNIVVLKTFRSLIYWSWFDIGKYVLKLSIFYVLKFYFEYRSAEKQSIQLAVINKDMQLNLLKQQLSPHFYFNTLNNIYGLARSNSARLSGALSQLADIMRYVITDCNQPKVLLRQEVNFLQSYIALEKLRYEQNTFIEMSVEGKTGEQTILPLLLIQFVENAFKHGMKEKSERSWMKVNMIIHENDLLFKVNNSFYDTNAADGIGINSVKHILNLQYEGKYDMKMLHKDNQFSVTLKLNLS
ncbi:MAG: sensor histidine kinase [Ferruginibacter sp.]